ncbi:polymorphic toxin-type HINT domain-containing protein [Myceligenerans indicum]|uniref:Hint domain-containing protein n=1 Tax=Myceligenerans indicum TaxID=2593663 RepID=A0ABS1LRB8_9MICO|nr:polymorphic toxin-type HINT domain-containing protein [Myceligenerans indicum]MBL0888822.1 hypothetical protein [Myceligenerans indicum]
MDANGEMAKVDLGNTYGATATYQYDAGTRRLANIGLYREDVVGSELDVSYTYDDAGNVLSQADQPDAAHMAAQQDTQCYSYDILNRLTEAWTPGNGDCSQDAFTGAMGGAAPYWTEWEFDQVGNRTRQIEHAPDGVATITAYEHGQGLGVDGAGPHAVTGIDVTTRATDGSETTVGADYAYDDAGRMTVRQHANGSASDALGWDAESELTHVGTGSAERDYVYDADGTRLVRFLYDNVYVTLPGGSEVFLKKTTGVIQTTRYYQFAGQTVAMRDGAGLGGVMSMVNDHHGTTVARVPNTNPATDAVERTYTDPYGNLRGGSWAPGPRGGFLSEFRDGTGLTLLGARYYDPQLGRFITLDPVLDLTDPQQWHGYAYSHSNPTTYSDPAGLREFASDTLHGDTPDQIRAAVQHTHGPGSGGRGSGGGSGGGGTGGGTSSGGGSSAPGGELEDTTVESAEIAEAREVSNMTVTDVVIDLGWDLLKDFVGWNDLMGCIEADVASCAWLAAGITPAGKGAKAIKALYRVIDGTVAFFKKQKKARKLLETVGAVCPVGGKRSFAATTPVLMADGTHKPISEIEIGDEVLATDPETGEQGARLVTHLWVHQDDLYEFEVDNELIVTTEDHPYWSVTDQTWEGAEELDRGEHVLTASGRTATVTRPVDPHTRETDAAYNLTVSDLHTYYVLAGARPVLVHNSSCGVNDARDALKGWQTRYIQMGDQHLRLTKERMQHFLERHHPSYRTGPDKAKQTNFRKNMSIQDVEDAIRSVTQQNRGLISSRGVSDIYQVEGVYGGVTYTMGIRNGTIGQFYPH